MLAVLGLGFFPHKACSQEGSAAPVHKPFGNPQVSQHLPSRTYHIEHYKLVLRFDIPKGEIFGDETLTLRPFRDGFQTFHLDCSQLDIESVSLLPPELSQVKGATPVALMFSMHDPRLTIILPRSYHMDDSLRVRIVYRGFPKAGITFVSPNKYYPNLPEEVWALNDNEYQRFWFPCYQYPDDKATSEVIVTVPGNLVAVSNGVLEGVQRKNGEATYHWVEGVPHSSYLTAIGVGPFKKYSQKYHNISVDYYVPRNADPAAVMRAYSQTPAIMAFYSKIFDYEYPYKKYAQIACRYFPDGGMENIDATTETDLTLADSDPRSGLTFYINQMIAHELAHQWFGDLVTTRDWANIWLNEGFAMGIEPMWVEHHEGEDAYRYEMWGNQNDARKEDEEKYRRPIVTYHYLYADQMYDSTTYAKGAAVLDMLRYVLGDRALFRSMHNYLVAYREKNADTHDFEDVIRDTTGQNLHWFFHEWVYMGGYPEYKAEAHWDPVREVEVVTVRQEQKIDNVTPIFDMPAELAMYGAKGQSKRLTVRVHLPEQVFTIPLGFHPKTVDFDPDDRIYKTLQFEKTVGELAEQAESDPSMMSRLWAVEQLGRKQEGQHDQVGVQALEQVLRRDPFWGVRKQAAESLGAIGGAEARSALLAALKKDTNSDVREAAAFALGRYWGERQAFQVLIGSLDNDSSFAVRAAAAEAIGGIGVREGVDALLAEVKTAPNQYVLAGLLRGLAASRDPRGVPILITETQTGVPERVRAVALGLLPSVRDLLKGHKDELVLSVSESLSNPYDFVRLAGLRLAGDIRLKAVEHQVAALASTAPAPEERQEAQKALAQIRGTPLPHNAWLP